MIDKYMHYQDINECLDAYDKYPEAQYKDYAELNAAYDEINKSTRKNRIKENVE